MAILEMRDDMIGRGSTSVTVMDGFFGIMACTESIAVQTGILQRTNFANPISSLCRLFHS